MIDDLDPDIIAKRKIAAEAKAAAAAYEAKKEQDAEDAKILAAAARIKARREAKAGKSSNLAAPVTSPPKTITPPPKKTQHENGVSCDVNQY